jgi:site-specific DNA-methyltransferase (adenine-specific)
MFSLYGKQYLLWATRGPMPTREVPVYLPGVLRHTTMSNGKVHITQKPLALMGDIVQVCPPGGTVFDMFMGSGTTAVAALKHGRRFIGCESVPECFDASVRRCREACPEEQAGMSEYPSASPAQSYR